MGGAANQPAATSIRLDLDPNFHVLPSAEVWRKQIATQVMLIIVDANQALTYVTGRAVFTLIRGDAALIPEELGFGPDSTRWYIQRHEDDTLHPNGTLAARRLSVAG